MKYIAFIVWLLMTFVMFILIFPAMVLTLDDMHLRWFALGDDILRKHD